MPTTSHVEDELDEIEMLEVLVCEPIIFPVIVPVLTNPLLMCIPLNGLLPTIPLIFPDNAIPAIVFPCTLFAIAVSDCMKIPINLVEATPLRIYVPVSELEAYPIVFPEMLKPEPIPLMRNIPA